MKKNQDTFHAILDAMAYAPSYAGAARAAGISQSGLWKWISMSQQDAAGNGTLVESYLGMSSIPLHLAIMAARKMALSQMISNLETRAIHGHDEVVMFQGKVCYREDPALLGFTDDELSQFGFRDRYLRDAAGNPIPLTIHHEPPVTLALAVAAAFAPKVYGSKSEVNINHSGNLGVHVVKRSFGREAPQQVEVVDHGQIADKSEGSFDTNTVDAPDLDADIHALAPDVLDDDALARADAQQAIFASRSAATVADSPSVVDPQPASVRNGQPLTALQKDLLARLAARPGAPERTAPVQSPEAAYDPPDDVGGSVVPGGTKHV